MAFAWSLGVRDLVPGAFARKSLWRALVPAALICVGALLLAPPWKSASPALPAVERSAPSIPTGADPTTVVGGLLVVGGALAALPWIAARLGARARGGGQIDLVEVRPLGGRRSLMVVAVGRRRFLIGASEHGMSALAELDSTKSFSQVAGEVQAGEGSPG